MSTLESSSATIAPYALPLLPSLHQADLTLEYQAIDQQGQTFSVSLIDEQAWTLFFNRQEIVTLMTIGDHPVLLALGYLVNQQLMPDASHPLSAVDVDTELRVMVARTHDATLTPALSRLVRTSGCGEGTLFEHVIQSLDRVVLSAQASLDAAVMLAMLQEINTTPSLYLHAGAIHGCVLCRQDELLAYVEDIGRHNAIDKLAGLIWINGLRPSELWLFTTGRLTTEMVLKAIQMQIPILVSRSGFTAAAVALARRANLTLIGRAKGKRFVLLSGEERVVLS